MSTQKEYWGNILMTLTLAYIFHDKFSGEHKIVVMADSRESKVNRGGEMLDHRDDAEKIIPFDRRLVIGKSGLTSFNIGDKPFYTNEIVEHFFNQNQNRLHNVMGKEILGGLVQTWNETLTAEKKKALGIIESNFALLLCKWEEDTPGRVIPKIHSYNSIIETIDTMSGGGGTAIGEIEAQHIIAPYFDFEKISEMSFDESIKHFKKGYAEVMDKVDTVGGHVSVYTLGPNRFQSRWHSRKIRN